MDRYDAIAAAGVFGVSAGLWMVYPPLSLLVAGVVLFVVGVRGRPGGDRS